jgi:hypothetical protein
MKKSNRVLDRVSIARPCASDWNQMAGDGQTRFCSACNKKVHDFSKMSRQQAARIVIASCGKLCARITRDGNGSIISLEPSPTIRTTGTRPSPLVAAVLGVTLTVGGVAPATAARAGSPAAVSAILENVNSRAAFQPEDGTATVTGTVLDVNGAGIGSADVKLLDMDTGETTDTTTSASGFFQFLDLSAGSYHLMTFPSGLSPVTTKIELQNGQQYQVTVDSPITVYGGGLSGVMGFDHMRLVELYEESDLVVVATEGPRQVVGKTHNQNEDPEQVRTSLTIRQTVKGSPRKSHLSLYETAPDDDQPSSTDQTPSLFFLKGSESQGFMRKRVYELTDFSTGRKKLDPGVLPAYIQHLNQLSTIEQGQHASRDIAEWLVQLAEDPATRYDGAHELRETTSPPPANPQGDTASRSTPEDDRSKAAVPSDGTKAAADNRGNRAQAAAAATKESSTPAALSSDAKSDVTDRDPQASAAAESTADSSADDSSTDETNQFGDLLSGTQVDRLANALFSSTASTRGDMELIGLLAERRDPRLAAYLVAEIRATQDSPTYTTLELVGVLSGILSNGVVQEFTDQVAECYGNYASQSKNSDSKSKRLGSKPEDSNSPADNGEASSNPGQTDEKPSPEVLAQKFRSSVHAFLVAVDQYYAEQAAAKLQNAEEGAGTR